MTIKDLQELLNRNNIPANVIIKTNSGWECGATEVNAVYYSSSKNEIHLVQEAFDFGYDEDTLKDETQKAHDWVKLA